MIRQLNDADDRDEAHIVRLLGSFMFQQHFCLVLEWLTAGPLNRIFLSDIPSMENRLQSIRKIAWQLMTALLFLQQQGIIHGDLKPQNVLLMRAEALSLKLIDFGNCLDVNDLGVDSEPFEMQTLFYRAPEILFGVPFGTEIDLWSIGCILAELLLGQPLFCATAPQLMPQCIIELLGPFRRNSILAKGVHARPEFFSDDEPELTVSGFPLECVFWRKFAMIY